MTCGVTASDIPNKSFLHTGSSSLQASGSQALMADRMQIRLQPSAGARFAANICLLQNGLPWNVTEGLYDAQLTSAFLTVPSRERSEGCELWHFALADLDKFWSAVNSTSVQLDIVGRTRFQSPVRRQAWSCCKTELRADPTPFNPSFSPKPSCPC